MINVIRFISHALENVLWGCFSFNLLFLGHINKCVVEETSILTFSFLNARIGFISKIRSLRNGNATPYQVANHVLWYFIFMNMAQKWTVWNHESSPTIILKFQPPKYHFAIVHGCSFCLKYSPSPKPSLPLNGKSISISAFSVKPSLFS